MDHNPYKRWGKYNMIEIGKYIDLVLGRYKLSLTGLANKLGYKSKTSINRIISGKARPDSLRKFEQKVRSTFILSQDEEKLLSEAVQSAIYGKEQFLTNQAIWEFVRAGNKTLGGKAELQITDIYDGSAVNLHSRYAEAQSKHLAILNCQEIPALFEGISGLLQSQNVTIDHYIYVDDNDVRTIHAFSSVMSIFYEKAYMGYARRKKPMDQPQDCGLNESDLAIVSWVDREGTARTDFITFTGPYHGTLMEVPCLRESSLKLLGVDRQYYTPIKRIYFECSAFEDYIRYSANYAALERDHAVWKIKPDIGVDQIPAWILRKAVQEGTTELDEQFVEVLDKLEAVYRERYHNTITKRKHTYTVFKRAAMRRFAMTGRTSDHFWMMRPFTPEERLVILTELLKQQMENPYVHMYFLKDDSTLRNVEIAYYEGEGMLILDSETSYNLKQNHSEVMIMHQKMLSLFKDFFMGELLQEHVIPESGTRDFLRHLIFEVEELSKAK